LISIDMSDLDHEIENLSGFIESKTVAATQRKGKKLFVVSDDDSAPSMSDLRTLIKRFLHQKGLSESYRVTEEKGVIHVTRRKERDRKKTDYRSGTKPSPSSTMPYFFPKRS
jgi:hypothetical protein